MIDKFIVPVCVCLMVFSSFNLGKIIEREKSSKQNIENNSDYILREVKAIKFEV